MKLQAKGSQAMYYNAMKRLNRHNKKDLIYGISNKLRILLEVNLIF